MSIPSLDVRTFSLGPLETNSYLLVSGGEAAVIDAGGDPSPILETLRDENLTLTHLLITHLHCDHLYGVKALADAAGVVPLASAAGQPLWEEEIGHGGFMGLPKVPDFAYAPLEEGDLELLGRTCKVISAPGHAPGSLCYYFADAGMVFVGDVLFYNGVGRSDLFDGNAKVLLNSIREKLFTLPSSTVVHPGHGPGTTIGDEKVHNPFASGFAV